MSEQYLSLVRKSISACLSAVDERYISGEALTSTTVGSLLASHLLLPFLPKGIRVERGHIIEQESGQMSDRFDIVIYDETISQGCFQNQGVDFFHIEAVLYCIHTTSKIDTVELERVHQLAKQIDRFSYWRAKDAENRKVANPLLVKVKHILLALNLDASINEHAVENYKQLYDKDGSSNLIQAICSVRHAYYFDNGAAWIVRPCQDQHDELLAMIGNIINSLDIISASRSPPPLGDFLIPKTKTFTGPSTGGLKSIFFSCVSCKAAGYAAPKSELKDVVLIGTLKHIHSCPKCRAEMRSSHGRYEFIGGRLVGVSFFSALSEAKISDAGDALSVERYLMKFKTRN